MGTYGHPGTKKELIEYLNKNYAEGYTLLKKRLVGNHLWHQVKDSKGNVFISLSLLSQEDGYAYYKPMTEDMHPFYYDCPKSLLKGLTEPRNEDSANWRKGVLEYHRKNNQKFNPGDRVRLGGEEYTIVQHYRGKSYVIKDDNGKTWRGFAKQMTLIEKA